MDSGNSGSLQSSSGGDEEYDSRAESISALLNNQSHVLPHQSSSSAMFDPLSSFFDPVSSRPLQLGNQNSLLNLDILWSKNPRSDPNSDFAGLTQQSQPFLSNQFGQSGRLPGGGSGSGSVGGGSNFPAGIQIGTETGSRAPAPNDQNGNNNNVVRNSKKRSRASRRAPTTVLTTDTSNFRAMVQEFTGIPAPPFTSSPFPRSRLDLFGTGSSIRSGNLDPSPPPYLLRPFAQKVQAQPPPSFLSVAPNSTSSSSTMVEALVGSNSNTTSINYQLSSDLNLLKQQPHQNLLNMNMHNPVLNFNTLLQAPPKFPSSINLSSNPHNDDPFGLSHGGQVGIPANIISSSDNNNQAPTTNNNWGDQLGSNNNGGQSHLLRSVNGGYNNSSERQVENGKLNYSASSSSDFNGSKAPENGTARSEGMVESWICSSD
ncbi:hypothetical protein UlMin_038577 [Ulmus minor]